MNFNEYTAILANNKYVKGIIIKNKKNMQSFDKKTKNKINTFQIKPPQCTKNVLNCAL